MPRRGNMARRNGGVNENPAPGGEGGAGRMRWSGRENREGTHGFGTAGGAARQSFESPCAEQPRHERQMRRRAKWGGVVFPLLRPATGRLRRPSAPAVQEDSS